MRLMAELAADHGMPMSESLAGTKIREAQLSDATLVVTAHQEMRMIENLMQRLGHISGLGIQAGSRYHFTAFGALGFAFASSRNARSALDVALQYFHLTFAFTSFTAADTAVETRVQVDDSGIPEAVVRFAVERDIANLVTVARDLYVVQSMLRSISFRFPAPADVEPYERLLGLKPIFGAQSNVVALDRDLIERPLPQANELTLSAAVDQCRTLLERRRVRTGLASTVRNRLVMSPTQMLTMESVASDLCMTVRTLRRRLTEEGTTFAELRDEVRMALADEFLAGPRLSIEQIAERLGYAQTSNFISAFKRWRGRTPHASRLNR